ncbi:YegS/Rv2252/BmrU family lipid kinase [Bacillus sp. 31A1R]|uniref:YegS/Rv2252/BmrU family lipid kinase n=1 Tax=Robertmurraya mangrovi TaxID=3098077 RepID=A0ABU5J475_9BACI|nr:YegS/Rv2252/BmrU family lipid kinase [Bacillus sp. 31A1R]MDZ5474198.1 YegS/Rv2252/BmrU family lipid kinase [Bacillus sp. 31A1R]
MKSIQKAMLIYNGNAGQKDINRTIGVCIPILSTKFEEILLLKTNKPKHAIELCTRYGSEMDLVIVVGGDGTVHECINGLAPLSKRPAIGIIPAGTCNDFARTLGYSLDIKEAALQIVEGERVPVDTIQVNKNYFINFWGIGLVTETSSNIKNKEKELLGRVSYFLSAIRTINEVDSFRYTIEYEDGTVNGEGIMILITNGNYIGTNKLPFKNISYDDGSINIFMVKEANMALLKELLINDASINDQYTNEIEHLSSQQFKITTEKILKADMDGEVYLETPCEFKVLKHHLIMVKPK